MMLAPNFQLNPPVPPSPPLEKTPTYTPDEAPSCGGHGTFEILEVTRFLEQHGIECCLVGVSALIFYGAGRVRNVWNPVHLESGRMATLTNHRIGNFVSPTTESARLSHYLPLAPWLINSTRYHHIRFHNLHHYTIPTTDSKGEKSTSISFLYRRTTPISTAVPSAFDAV